MFIRIISKWMGSFLLNTKFVMQNEPIIFKRKKNLLNTICFEIFKRNRKHTKDVNAHLHVFILYHYQSTPACLSGLHTTVEFVFYIFHHQTYPSLLLHCHPLLPHPPHPHLLSTQKKV